MTHSAQKTVLFDMDGVLIDAREWHYNALNEALEIFGYHISSLEHLERFDGMTTKMKLKILSDERGLPSSLHDLISDVKQDRTLRIAAAKCYPNVQHLILIIRLRELGFKVGVVTNSIRKTTEFMLNYAGILDYLDILITNEDVKRGKPSPEGYLKAMKELGATPEDTWVVEDGEYGVEAARNAGANVIRVSAPDEVNLQIFENVFPELLQ
jgi:HAD superfamily hydrolase (TIGR01509 family)